MLTSDITTKRNHQKHARSPKAVAVNMPQHAHEPTIAIVPTEHGVFAWIIEQPAGKL